MGGSAEEMPAGRSPKGARGAPVLNGHDLRRAFESATRCLERHRDAINALNVFPVPDGDTGTNMLLTMRSVNEESLQEPGSSAGLVAKAMGHGALLGARGNSGVILSQFFQGLAQGLQGKAEFDGVDLARAFDLASKAADSAVSKPVDGTMLTVIRELSLAASRHIERRGSSKDVPSVLRAALETAKEALSRTPLQLPVLREAGVVDAGGQGVVTLLEGAWQYLVGGDVDELELEICAPAYGEPSAGDISLVAAVAQPIGQITVQEQYLAATEDELYGYCTQFLVQGQELDLGRMREDLSALAQSTVVVGNGALARVHVHAQDPGPVISYAVSLGTIGQVTMDNIDRQHEEFVALHRSRAPSLPEGAIEAESSVSRTGSTSLIEAPHDPEARSEATEVVAVVWGEGTTQLFKGLGCAAIVAGGQTMNPSTQELLNAARGTGARDVILLPNNPNIIPSALQAASIAKEGIDQTEVRDGGLPHGPGLSNVQGMVLHVVPSRTIPQGVTALLAFNPEGTLEANLESMEKALATVRTVEVTRAVRPANLGGLAVEEGQYSGLLEGELVAVGDSALLVLQQALSEAVTVMDSQDDSLRPEVLTLYWGGDIQEGQAQAAAAQLKESIAGVEVEVVYGGQPFYQYIASLE